MATKKRKKPTMALEAIHSLLDEHEARLDYHVDWLAELTEDIKKLKVAAQPKPEPEPVQADRYKVVYWSPQDPAPAVYSVDGKRLVAQCSCSFTVRRICDLLNKHGL